ncbi:MAG: helix-turn-helix domain-containing protein [Piscinibacter sp.]|nr:helix-turn-helix domain-containing protein [Piscinibacter sp.]
MLTAQPLVEGPLAVTLYRCSAGPAQAPFTEQYRGWSASYVLRGSFGCRCRGRHFELVPGSVLVGRPGDEFTCTHEHHHGGDECLAFAPDAALADELGAGAASWQSGALPPLPGLIGLGELGRAGAAGHATPALDEVGLALVARIAGLLRGTPDAPLRPGRRDRQRAVESALWIDAHSAERCELPQLARQAGLSAYHYLRVFGAVLGVTPHQYLVRSRLRRAAEALATGTQRVTDIALDVGFDDLSNFTRSFGRATGLSPRAFRRAARRDRNFLQERIGTGT